MLRNPLFVPPPTVIYAPPAYHVPPPPAPVVYSPPPAPAAEQQCREYQSTTMINGQPQQIVGTTRLQPDGTWRIVR
jgi:hypothetical protein